MDIINETAESETVEDQRRGDCASIFFSDAVLDEAGLCSEEGPRLRHLLLVAPDILPILDNLSHALDIAEAYSPPPPCSTCVVESNEDQWEDDFCCWVDQNVEARFDHPLSTAVTDNRPPSIIVSPHGCTLLRHSEMATHAASTAPELVKISRAISVEDPQPAFTVGTKLSASQRQKHKGWAAKKNSRVKYGRKYEYTHKAEVARNRKRQEGKFQHNSHPTTK